MPGRSDAHTPRSVKGARHRARIAAVQGLYQLDMHRAASDAATEEMIAPVLAEAGLTGPAAEYARRLATGAWAKREVYDGIIAGVSDHWEVSRMAVVDRNILRLAMYELMEQPDVPPRVVIDEAVEIGREFGEAETPQFINGVLDAVFKTRSAGQVPRSEPDGRGDSGAPPGPRLAAPAVPSADDTRPAAQTGQPGL